MVRNEIATFQWTTRTTSIDWRFLQKDQIVNHFSKANFTTKVSKNESNLQQTCLVYWHLTPNKIACACLQKKNTL